MRDGETGWTLAPRRRTPTGVLATSALGLALLHSSMVGCYLSHDRAAPVGPRDAGLDAPRPAPDVPALDAPPRSDAGDCAPRGEMVAVSGAHPHRIDATEVTQEEYARFLRCAEPAPPRPGCAAAVLLPGPAGNFDPDGTPRVPVHDVSSCAAAAYCAWAGRRLCDLDSEWLPACLATEVRVGIGEVRDYRSCVLGGFDDIAMTTEADVPVPVRSAPLCRGASPPYDRVYDIIGNVSEHVTRPGAAGADVVGMNYGSGPHRPCFMLGVEPRLDPGFRCCAD